MRIGYACQTLGLPGVVYRSCLRQNASEARLLELIEHNLRVLDAVIAYNLSQEIRLFRISSDLIPFGSSPVNPLPWWQLFADQLAGIGARIRGGGMRVSMHPGQYTVLNAADPAVACRAVDDLVYHNRVLDGLGLGPEHKIVLHIGGVYGDKPAALQRFVAAVAALDPALRRRLVIENDEISYTIADVLAVGRHLAVPVVFDNLHHQLNPPPEQRDDLAWIEICRPLWTEADGPQKIHYAQQDPLKRRGAHAETIAVSAFVDYCRSLSRDDLDIMLEVKDKNWSARKCQICLSAGNQMQALEQEWSRYKYLVLEHAPAIYQEIRRLLRDKTGSPALAFYALIEQALLLEPSPGQVENAALHVWGYFKRQASEREIVGFQALLDRYRGGQISRRRLKAYLAALTKRYSQPYLSASYYFSDKG
jgi:UV DNA damage endonuclease